MPLNFKSAADTVTLNNGVKMPCVGFGTWQARGETCTAAVKMALACGYRHIDTACAYRNEDSVGQAVRESGVPRSEIFVVSKLDNPYHGYDATMANFEQSMKLLNMDYLDLYLIHWPNPKASRHNWEEANAGAWRAFEELYTAGRVRSLGISNFHSRHIDALMKTAKIPPAVNQIRLCPGDTQPEVVDYCRVKGMALTAYSPLGAGEVFDVPEMQGMAARHGKTVAQICLRWSLQMGFIPLPKSATERRIRENAALFDFELTDGDMAVIAGLTGRCGHSMDPDTIEF